MSTTGPAFGLRWRTILVRGAAALLCLYVATVSGFLIFEDRFIYHPYHEADRWVEPPASPVGEDVWLQSATGDAIHAWWSPRSGSKIAVLFCHGNTGNLSWARCAGGDVSSIGEVLGASVLVFDYPGFGRSSGTPSEAGCYAAADAAHDWLRARMPAERIVILGQSLGGGIATDLACRRPHRALALYETFTAIPDVIRSKFPLMPARAWMHNQFDSLAKIERCEAPVFIGHGVRDHLIPLTQAQRLYAAARSPKEFLAMPEGGHDDGVRREYLVQLAAFLRSH